MSHTVNSTVAKRCICGSIPVVRPASNEGVACVVECIFCDVDSVIGSNRHNAIQAWNEMIDKLKEE